MLAATAPLAVAALGCAADAPDNEVRVVYRPHRPAEKTDRRSTSARIRSSDPQIVLSTHGVTVGDVEVRFGTPVEDLPAEIRSFTSTSRDCETVVSVGRVEFLATDGVLRRARATGGRVETPSGISVGTDVDVLEETFPRRLQQERVAGEESIVFVPSAEEERDRRMIFQTRAGRVTEIRAGMIPWVYWESCP